MSDTPEVQDSDYTFPEASDPTPTPEPAPEPEAAPAPAVPEPKYVQVTEEDWNKLQSSVADITEMKAENKRLFDSAFGKLGGLEQFVNLMRAQTPSGVQITEEDVADFAAEYPELGALQLKVLQKVATKLKGTAVVDPAQFKSLVEGEVGTAFAKVGDTIARERAPTVQQAKMEIARETLDATHEGWSELIGLPNQKGEIPKTAFRDWLAKQPEAYQKRLNDSFSPVVVGRAIDEFRKTQKAPVAKAPAAPQPQTRNKLLGAAVQPQGTGAVAPTGMTPEEQMAAGYS